VNKAEDIPNLSVVMQSIWSFLVCTVFLASLFSAKVQAQGSSNNLDSYNFGWIAMGVYDTGAIPTLGTCFNVEYSDETQTLKGSLVILTECYGAFSNELWACINITRQLMMLDVDGINFLCCDASSGTMEPCNSSAISQQWSFEGNS
jgi:hypothetical protein